MVQGAEELLVRGGVDYVDAMDRFDGNEGLYLRLLAKYPDDPHCERLADAFEKGDVESIRREIHAIKGVAGNLSLATLCRAVSNLSEVLQSNGVVAARALYSDVQKAHDDAVAVLGELHREEARQHQIILKRPTAELSRGYPEGMSRSRSSDSLSLACKDLATA